jgi:hypothetical protein
MSHDHPRTHSKAHLDVFLCSRWYSCGQESPRALGVSLGVSMLRGEAIPPFYLISMWDLAQLMEGPSVQAKWVASLGPR